VGGYFCKDLIQEIMYTDFERFCTELSSIIQQILDENALYHAMSIYRLLLIYSNDAPFTTEWVGKRRGSSWQRSNDWPG